MSILDEYGIKSGREEATATTEATEQTAEVNNAAEATTTDLTTEQTQETTQPAETQTTTNHNTVDAVQEKPVSQFANEEVARMNSYLTKYPEKTIDDYKALTTPVESLKEEDLLRSYLSEKEGKTKSEIDYALKQLELKEQDPDFDPEFDEDKDSLEELKKKGDRERMILEARKWHEDFVKSELNFDGDNQTTQEAQPSEIPSIEKFIQDAQVKHQEYTQNYLTKIYEALPQLDKIELEVGGESFSFIPDENFKTEMRKGAEDISKIGNEYFDETANIKDAKGFITNNTLWANPKTRQPMIEAMIEQAINKHIAKTDKARRNITLDDATTRSVPQSTERGDVVDKIFSNKRGSF